MPATQLDQSNPADVRHTSLLTYLDNAGKAAMKCSALISPLYQFVDEMEKGRTPKTAMKLLRLIGVEFGKYKVEIQKYWETPDRAQNLFDKASLLEDAQFEFSVYMKIFITCDWSQISEGSSSIGIRIFERLADELSESVTLLYLEVYKLQEKEKPPISSAA